MVNIIKHNTVQKLMAESKRLAPDIDISNLEPIIASNDGYILTQDKRILLRMGVGSAPVNLWRSETKDLGLDTPGVSPKEAYAFISRLASMPAYEQAALVNQRDAARLRSMLSMVYDAMKDSLPRNLRVDVAMLLKDTE